MKPPSGQDVVAVTNGTPGMTFSHKVEYGAPPFVQLWVRPTWVRQVAHAGWAVLLSGRGNRKERDRRSRADYLREDGETWTSGPDGNPDVVE